MVSFGVVVMSILLPISSSLLRQHLPVKYSRNPAQFMRSTSAKLNDLQVMLSCVMYTAWQATKVQWHQMEITHTEFLHRCCQIPDESTSGRYSPHWPLLSSTDNIRMWWAVLPIISLSYTHVHIQRSAQKGSNFQLSKINDKHLVD